MTPTVSINFDFELLTGWRQLDDDGYERHRDEMHDVRERIRALVGVLEEHSVPTTWNTVGHLFLDSCDGHPEMGGISRDPKTSADASPLWYGPDLIAALIESDAEIDIGSHSFSHDVFSEISGERARGDFEAFERAVGESEFEVTPTSFVFPQNKEGHHEICVDHGFRIYRGNEKPYYRMGSSLPEQCYKAWLLATGGERGGAAPPRVDEHGMVRIENTVYLSRGTAGGIGKLLCWSPLRESVVEYVGDTIQGMDGDDHLHLWAHPHEFRNGLPEDRFRAVCELLEREADRGTVTLCTMDELAERALDRRTT